MPGEVLKHLQRPPRIINEPAQTRAPPRMEVHHTGIRFVVNTRPFVRPDLVRHNVLFGHLWKQRRSRISGAVVGRKLQYCYGP